jgi:hypothetical protein
MADGSDFHHLILHGFSSLSRPKTASESATNIHQIWFIQTFSRASMTFESATTTLNRSGARNSVSKN